MAEYTKLYVRHSTGDCLNNYYYLWDGQITGRCTIDLVCASTGQIKQFEIENLKVYSKRAVVQNANCTLIFKK